MVTSDDETTTAVEDAVLTSDELSYPTEDDGVVAFVEPSACVLAAEWVLVFPTAGVIVIESVFATSCIADTSTGGTATTGTDTSGMTVQDAPPSESGGAGSALAKSLCLAWLCWCWRHAACVPPGADSACSGHPLPSVLPLSRNKRKVLLQSLLFSL